MTEAEDLLADNICIGYLPGNQRNLDRLHVPTLWEVAHDLESYVKKGLIQEIPVKTEVSPYTEHFKKLS